LRHAIHTASVLVAALASVCCVAACGDSPTTPSPGSGPKLSCPASISQVSPVGAAIVVAYPLPTVSGGLAPLAGPVCTPPAGSSFPPGANNVACTITDSQGRSDLCTFTITVTLPPTLAVTRFIAFGDSITYGEDGTNNVLQGFNPRTAHPAVQLIGQTYPDDLQGELSARYTLQAPMVSNQGVRDEPVLDVQGVPGGATRFGMIPAGTYDVALLMEGANDLVNVASGLTTIPAVAAGLGQMIDHARLVGIRPFLATIPPENPDMLTGCSPQCRGGEAALVPPFNDQVRALAASKGVPLVDVYLAFNGNLSLIGPDGLHPNAAGYQLIADTFFAAIKQNLEVASATTTHSALPLRSGSAVKRR
jgi:lysophospholipase L1-like esterase